MKVDKTQFYSGNKRHLKETMSQKSLPLSSYPMTQINNRYLERPLKNNSKNLSFKGLSFMGDDKKKRKLVNPTLFLSVLLPLLVWDLDLHLLIKRLANLVFASSKSLQASI